MPEFLKATPPDYTLDKSLSLTSPRELITEYKNNARGPFGNVRWFCNNGQVIVPRAGNCNNRGDGVQHGQLLPTANDLRSHGWQVATVFADINYDQAVTLSSDLDNIAQIILERYLVTRDDGWIFRKARFIRGMLQIEDEIKGANTLLKALFSRRNIVEDHYLLLREAVRLFPGHYDEGTLHYVRAESARLASRDRNFTNLKNKLHNQPEPSDVDAVFRYANQAPGHLRKNYLHLAENLSHVFDMTRNTDLVMKSLNEVSTLELPSKLRDSINTIRSKLKTPRLKVGDTEQLFEVMYELRRNVVNLESATERIKAMELSTRLEDHLVAQLLSRTNPPELLPRRDLLQHLYHLGKALYGIGLLSEREQHALSYAVAHVLEDSISIAEYDYELQYLQRALPWSLSTLQYEFNEAVAKFDQLDPLVNSFVDDRLRASLLARYGRLLNVLLKDSSNQTRRKHSFFNKEVTSGIRSMNAGLARGILIDPTQKNVPVHNPANSIYLVPETVATLPAVAGILTKAEGNPLSHVQLLARNLGIPNIVIGPHLLDSLKIKVGRPIVVASSPAGQVVIADDSHVWDEHFPRGNSKNYSHPELLKPDINKLDLDNQRPVDLKKLKSQDSGRIVGPKAAKLGELKSMFPNMVTEGLALPFGMFNLVLESRINSKQTLHEWMKTAYADIRRAPAGQYRARLIESTLARIREFINDWTFPFSVRSEILTALRETFGREGSYGVFVRSDTNVEDLPNFTGAGLNLTVPNVVGTDNILKAIKNVWASPFTDRSFSWRQAWMTNPEHVYTSILLLKSVPSDRSGVMMTGDVDTGDLNYLTVAVNEGIGGVVDNQKAESILLDRQSGVVRLLSVASAREKRVLSSQGGLINLPVTKRRELLTPHDLLELNRLALRIHEDFDGFERSTGTGIADVEFGFVGSKLVLFQIRPFVQNGWVQEIKYLRELDKKHRASAQDDDKIRQGAIRLSERVYAQL
jgi:hypothetical protein